MHRHLCDAVADDRVHGFSHGTERWFVHSGEIHGVSVEVSGYTESSPFMSGKNLGIVAASHSSNNRVLGVEVASTVFSSMFFTEILMSVFTPIPPKSTRKLQLPLIAPGKQPPS